MCITFTCSFVGFGTHPCQDNNHHHREKNPAYYERCNDSNNGDYNYEGIEGIKTIQIYFIHIPDDLESLGIMVGVMML